MNKFIFYGRLTKDPESRDVGDTSVCNISVAVKKDFKREDDEFDAHFFNLIIWGKSGETVQQYFQKGREIIAEGTIEPRTWEDNDGNKRYTTDYVVKKWYFAGSAPKDGESTQEANDDNLPFNKKG